MILKSKEKGEFREDSRKHWRSFSLSAFVYQEKLTLTVLMVRQTEVEVESLPNVRVKEETPLIPHWLGKG